MTEFQVALSKVLEIYKLIQSAIEEHNGRHSIVRKCEQTSYNQLKSIAIATDLPYLSKYDQLSFEERKSWSSFWILSPLIGKKQMREGKSDFLIGITKVEKQRPTFSLLLAPQKEELFIGINSKAYKINISSLSLDTEIDQLITEDNLISEPAEGLFFSILKKRNKMNIRTEKFLDDFKMHKSGAIQEKVDESPMNLIGIAEGKYDFYVDFKAIYEWDIAPFDALISASGNRVTQKDGILPLEYNSKRLKFSSFIAKNNADIDSIDFIE